MLQEYLRSRVAMLTSEKSNVSNKILVSSILQAMGYADDDENMKRHKQMIIKQSTLILDYWKEKNLFTDYTWEYDTLRKNSRRAIVIEK